MKHEHANRLPQQQSNEWRRLRAWALHQDGWA
jgi:hypothetical protein